MLARRLLAVGSQPGTIITAVTCARHVIISSFHHFIQPWEADEEGEPQRGSHSQKVGKPGSEASPWDSNAPAISRVARFTKDKQIKAKSKTGHWVKFEFQINKK